MFIESDETDVRLRPVLVPADPSYPKVQDNRFARVGEKIATLRVGVVDSEGAKTQWLPIETPPEGFYLGEVDWAGNSDEVVVEPVELPEHRVVRMLEYNSELRAKMKQMISHPTEFLKLDIGDGVSMDAWMIKPKDFDESKKYPVFIYVYGEPYAQTVLAIGELPRSTFIESWRIWDTASFRSITAALPRPKVLHGGVRSSAVWDRCPLKIRRRA